MSNINTPCGIFLPFSTFEMFVGKQCMGTKVHGDFHLKFPHEQIGLLCGLHVLFHCNTFHIIVFSTCSSNSYIICHKNG